MKSNFLKFNLNSNKKAKLTLVSVFILTAIVLLTTQNVKQPTETRQRAAGNARLFFQPTSSNTTPIQKNINDTFSVQLMLNPGLSRVSFIKFEILYDQTKLQVSNVGAVVINSNIFPMIFEGPVLTAGKIAASVSIGNDPTKAITAQSQIAKVTFKALANTGGFTQISTSNHSQALSLAAEQSATDNVIEIMTPAYVAIGPYTSPTINPNEPTITNTPTSGPSITLGPSATSGPSPTSGGVTPQPTNTLGGPTATHAPDRTIIALNLRFHGIGSGGDSANPNKSTLSNKNPINQERNLNIQIVNEDNEIVVTKLAPAFYNSDTGMFFSNIVINESIPEGDYVVKVKAEAYLRKLMPGFISVKPGKKNEMKVTDLVAGDINDDNAINALDYNVLYDCGYGEIKPLPILNTRSEFRSRSCQSHEYKNKADINDNGTIEASDYNLFIRELSVQFGV